MATWTFLTNHGHVLVCIAQDPGVRGRDIAERVGITERAAQAIVSDLVDAGYVRRRKVGRRNHYEIDPDLPVRHPVEQPHSVGDLLTAVAGFQPEIAGRTLSLPTQPSPLPPAPSPPTSMEVFGEPDLES
ncbi:MAG: helix-turn-helix transcriptional regulator [Acidimicrobiales bacterium]